MQRILVTGASSGIGLAVSERLLGEGVQVLMLSENLPELEDSCAKLGRTYSGNSIVPVHFDLTELQNCPGLWGELEERHGAIDGLVNNAGIGLHASLLDSQPERIRLVFEVNFFAPLLLSRQALAAMASRRQGVIVNVTSASARRALAKMGAYASSKAALHSLSQTLRLEAAPLGVKVCEVLPISTRTKFFDRASYQPKGLVQSSDRVAQSVVTVLRTGTPELCTHGLTAWGLGLDGLFPNAVARLLQWLHNRNPEG
jgi:short-subunit dehydrogenase